jgi:hypothetical protein
MSSQEKEWTPAQTDARDQMSEISGRGDRGIIYALLVERDSLSASSSYHSKGWIADHEIEYYLSYGWTVFMEKIITKTATIQTQDFETAHKKANDLDTVKELGFTVRKVREGHAKNEYD